jgi:hypothetical protein
VTALNATSSLWSNLLDATQGVTLAELGPVGPDCCWYYDICCWIGC